MTLQMAKHDRGAVLLRKTVEFRVQDVPQIIDGRTGRRGGNVNHRLLPVAAPAVEGPRLPGDAERDAIKPIGHQPRSPQRRPFADEHEEGGLKGVIGIRAGAEQPPADTEDHRAVAAHEQFERRPVSDFREPS